MTVFGDPALNLLERTWSDELDIRLTDTCLRVGFGSLGSFSARFTAETGRSPRVFQRELRAFGSVPARLEALYVPMCFLLGPGGGQQMSVPEKSSDGDRGIVGRSPFATGAVR